MKVNSRESLSNLGKFFLAMPAIAFFGAGYSVFSEALNDLITGRGSDGSGGMLLPLAMMAVYVFLCMRLNLMTLHFGTVLLCSVMLLCQSDLNVITKVIMVLVSLVILIVPFVLAASHARKTAVKYDKRRFPPDQEKRYRETMAMLPSDRAAFRRYCSGMSAEELQHMAKDKPALLFRQVPCREALQYICSQDPNGAMMLINLFIRFGPDGRLIPF